MGQEDWLVFRNKIAKLDEFLEVWMTKLNEVENQLPIIFWLKNQIETYKVYLRLLCHNFVKAQLNVSWGLISPLFQFLSWHEVKHLLSGIGQS